MKKSQRTAIGVNQIKYSSDIVGLFVAIGMIFEGFMLLFWGGWTEHTHGHNF
jgi:hypothetical protein